MYVGFDLDGVLLDSTADLSWLDRGLDRALATLGLPKTEANRRMLYPDSVADLERVADQFDVEAERLWDARTHHYTESKVRAIRSGEIAPFDDLDELDRLSDQTLFCVSNSPTEVIDAFFETTGLEEDFATWVGRGHSLADLDRLKPDRALFEPIHDRLGEGEYVYVGDRDSDRTFAARTSMGYVHLDRRNRSLADVITTVATDSYDYPSDSG